MELYVALRCPDCRSGIRYYRVEVKRDRKPVVGDICEGYTINTLEPCNLKFEIEDVPFRGCSIYFAHSVD